MPATPEAVLREYQRLVQDRQWWMEGWNAIASTMLPAYHDLLTPSSPGPRRTGDLYDTTGLQGLTTLASHLAGAVTNFQTRWFDLRMALAPLNEDRDTAAWLDGCAQTIQDALAATATPQAFHELYVQYAGFGTAALFVDEGPAGDPRRLLTRTLPIGTYVLAEDAHGAVDTLYREFELSPRQAAQQFGEAALHADARQRLDNAERRHTPERYLHAVYPRRDRDPGRDDQAHMPYASVYLDVARQHLVSEGGYRWFPFCVPRWQKLRSSSPWGFGPGHTALPEVLTLNRMDKDILKALQIHILPPYWTDDADAVGRVSLLPGAINPIGKGSKIEAMRGPGSFDISRLGMEERRQRIRQAFYVDQLLALPPPDASGKMTAYEVAQRVSLMQRLMGPAFMRLLAEFLNPFLDIVFGLMLEAGQLPEPPDLVAEAAARGYGTLQVDYEGPLARAQRGDEIQAIEGTLALAERLFATTQDVSIYDNFDLDEVLRRGGRIYGIPAAVMRDATQVRALREQRQAAQQASQEAAALTEGAQALGRAAPMVKALMPAPGQEVAA